MPKLGDKMIWLHTCKYAAVHQVGSSLYQLLRSILVLHAWIIETPALSGCIGLTPGKLLQKRKWITEVKEHRWDKGHYVLRDAHILETSVCTVGKNQFFAFLRLQHYWRIWVRDLEPELCFPEIILQAFWECEASKNKHADYLN